MSYSPERSGPEPSDADAANDAIRALVDGADGQWPAEEYERLLAEWAAAVGEGVPLATAAARPQA
ncbi:hypothetical protein ACGFW5_19415 [Streptomyces sp. NPDC048416]|uniref:hypothetical protein n=1 Tax=Streptomyces sp. NPDC048416 TaxID=3365546 RepID=UPI00371B073D